MKPDLLITEIPFRDPLAAFEPFAGQPYALLFDGALPDDKQGRYAFIAVDPFLTLQSKHDEINLAGETFTGDPFQVLQDLLAQYPLPRHPDLPPFRPGRPDISAMISVNILRNCRRKKWMI